MLRSTFLALGIGALLAAPALASTPVAGEVAPELAGANWILNAPDNDSTASMLGEVILIEAWGIH